jgi:hypothetical protein
MFGAVAAPAAAATPTPTEQCAAIATQRELPDWSCLDGTVTYRVVDETTTNTGRIISTSASGEVWAQEQLVATPLSARIGSRVGASPLQVLSNYSAKSANTVVYGDGSQTIGTFDLSLKTNLNGGQPWFWVTFFKLSGPNVTIHSTVNCVWDKLFDGTCGHFPVETVYAGNYSSNRILGTKVPSAGMYFSTLTGNYTPDGYGNHAFPTLRNDSWVCTTRSLCQYP